MRLFYTTDLHGIAWKYDMCHQLARQFQADIVVNGGDMLPKADLFAQDRFLEDYLSSHFKQYSDTGIPYLCCLGNDDLRIWDKAFDQLCNDHEGISNLAQRSVELNGFTFIGMNWIPDTPFGLKDRCLMDTQSFTFPEQFGPSVLSTPDGWQELEDWESYARGLPTVEDKLMRLPQPTNQDKAVYVLHCPPYQLGLDICSCGKRVGSKAIYEFIKEKQPHLALHGHIHEASKMTGEWQGYIGETLCIQPGQLEDFSFAIIDLESLDAAVHTLPQRHLEHLS